VLRLIQDGQAGRSGRDRGDVQSGRRSLGGVTCEGHAGPRVRRRAGSQSLSASDKSTSIKLRCRYARRTMAPPVRPAGLRGCTAWAAQPRDLRRRVAPSPSRSVRAIVNE